MRTTLSVRKHREKRRRFPATQAVLFRAQMLAAAQVSRLPCLPLLPLEPSGRKWKGKKCGSIATTVGWCSARIIGFIFGRTFSSGIGSPLPRPTPSLLALPSKAASVSSAMTAAKSISINPQKCSNTSRSFLTLSLRIRYFEIVRGRRSKRMLLSCRGTVRAVSSSRRPPADAYENDVAELSSILVERGGAPLEHAGLRPDSTLNFDHSL